MERNIHSCSNWFLRFSCAGVSGAYDIAVAFDTSSEISEDDLSALKQLAGALLDSFQISSRDTKIALVSFNENVRIVSSFKESQSMNQPKLAINNIRRVAGSQRFDKLFTTADSTIFTPREGSRGNVPKLLLVFTKHGKDYQTNSISQLNARQLKQKAGLLIVGLGYDKNDREALTAITGDVNDVLPVENPSALKEHFGVVEKRVAENLSMFLFIT